MDISVLGPGCRNCSLLEKRVHEALAQLGQEHNVVKVTDYDEIFAMGVIATPGLVINGDVVVSGKVPTVSHLVSVLTSYSAT